MNRYKDAIDHLLKQYAKDLAPHQLQVLAETPEVQCYRMFTPGTRINIVQITFTPEGIAIQGDYCPGQNGVCSTCGYGRFWFAEELGESYLCEKFLTQEFVPEAAADFLEEFLEEPGRSLDPQVLEEGKDLVTHLECSTRSEAMEQYVNFCSDLHIDDPGGYAYPIRDRAILAAIQKRFSELWKEKVK